MAERGTLHHLEVWVADLDESERTWGWLLGALGYQVAHRWTAGVSWAVGASYVGRGVVLGVPWWTPDQPHERVSPSRS